MIAPGDKVFLRACHAGEPGTVIREQRGKVTVFWPDLDYWGKHRPESLEKAPTAKASPSYEPPAAA